MTDKAMRIMQKLKRQDGRKHLLFRTSATRDRVLDQFNRSNLDDVGPLGSSDQQMRVLGEMNSLADDHDEFVKSLVPKVDLP